MIEDEELAIGIDLGTTFSSIAVIRNNKVEIIPNENWENLTPSVVSFVDGKYLVGEQTLDQLIINPKNTIYNVKRLIGRMYRDDEILEDIKSGYFTFDIIEDKKSKRPLIKIENKEKKSEFYFPEQISKFILEKLVKSANNYLEQTISKVVITVPAYFNNSQRNATKIAAEQAGLEVLRIFNEPTAASLAYGLDKKLKLKNSLNNNINKDNNQEEDEDYDEKYIIVFDLGGGTFDVTLLKIQDQEIFSVKATDGDSHLGGNDFDNKIIDFCLNEFCSKLKVNKDEIKRNKTTMNRLKIASEKAKIKLSLENEAIIFLDDFYKNEILHIRLSREIFENICEDLFEKLFSILEKVIDYSNIKISLINEIVFTGGSSRIPKIKELIKIKYPTININDSINPEEAVAYGAAILASKLIGNENDIINDIYLNDITQFSLGIDIANLSENLQIKKKGNLMSVIIPKGSRIPIEKNKLYETSYDNQDFTTISIYEGEYRYAKDNHLLGIFKLLGLPKKPKGEVKINVTFSIDENGIINISAFETSQGIKNSLKIVEGNIFDNDEKFKNNNNNRFLSLVYEDLDIVKNKKKAMKKYYNCYKVSQNNKEKYKYIKLYSEILVEYIITFGEDENDTLGNKYLLNIKYLFISYKIMIEFSDIINEDDINTIKNNSKNFIKTLSKFKNINYIDYIELLDLFLIPLSESEKQKSIEIQKEINKLRNEILFSLVIVVMKILEEKAEKILINKSKLARYNSKKIFKNCIEIGQRYFNFKTEEEAADYFKYVNAHNEYIENCKKKISQIYINTSAEMDKLKISNKLFEKTNKMKEEEILLLLDKYWEILQNIKENKNYEYEAIIIANIVKINYKYLNNENYKELIKMATDSINKIKDKNNEKYPWISEINNILEELKIKLEEKEKKKKEQIKNIIKDDLEIIEKFPIETNKQIIDFIEYILENYPPNRKLLKKKNNVKRLFEEKSIDYLDELCSKYHPDNLSKKTEKIKIDSQIYRAIIVKLNKIISKIREEEEDQ